MANAYRRYSLLSLLTIAAVAVWQDCHALARSIRNFIGLAFVWLAPEPQPFLVGGYSPFAGHGDPLDSALQNGMRHEANVSRRAAARHT